jgi:hypothetical protein
VTGEQRHANVPTLLAAHAARHDQLAALAVWTWLEGEYGGCIAGVFPGVSRVAVSLGVSRSTVQRAVAWLEDQGWMTVSEQFTEAGRQTTNLYVLHDLPCRQPLDLDTAGRRRRREIRQLRHDVDPVDNFSGNDRDHPGMRSLRRVSPVTPSGVAPVTPNSIFSSNELTRRASKPVEKREDRPGPALPTRTALEIAAELAVEPPTVRPDFDAMRHR